MAQCPKWRYNHPAIEFCVEPGSQCIGCPAQESPRRYVLQAARWLVRLALPLALLLSPLASRPALAAHNPAHDCPAEYARAIAAGAMGGKAQIVGDGTAQWTGTINGKTFVCILKPSVIGNAKAWIAKTLFRCSKPECYLARQAQLKGVQQPLKPGPLPPASSIKAGVPAAASLLVGAIYSHLNRCYLPGCGNTCLSRKAAECAYDLLVGKY